MINKSMLNSLTQIENYPLKFVLSVKSINIKLFIFAKHLKRKGEFKFVTRAIRDPYLSFIQSTKFGYYEHKSSRVARDGLDIIIFKLIQLGMYTIPIWQEY